MAMSARPSACAGQGSLGVGCHDDLETRTLQVGRHRSGAQCVGHHHGGPNLGP